MSLSRSPMWMLPAVRHFPSAELNDMSILKGMVDRQIITPALQERLLAGK